MIGHKFEHALKILSARFPEDTKKPALFHSLRVGALLWEYGYDEQIQISGLFHDALEDTDISREEIQELFGEEITVIVVANSKNTQLPKDQILEDIVKRCFVVGEAAIVVKVFDVYDNFRYYTKTENASEILRCQKIAQMVLSRLGTNQLSQVKDVLMKVMK